MPQDTTPDLPADFDNLASGAHEAARRQDWGVSLSLWGEACRLFPERPESLIGAGEALLHLSRYDEADETLTAAMTQLPGAMRPAELFARVAHDRRDWPEAIARWKALRVKFPDLVEPFRGYADALRDSGCHDEAEIVYRHAMRRFPSDYALTAGYALTASRQLLWDEACARWRTVKRLFPEESGGDAGIVEAMLALGRSENAQTGSREISALAPEPENTPGHPASPGAAPLAMA